MTEEKVRKEGDLEKKGGDGIALICRSAGLSERKATAGSTTGCELCSCFPSQFCSRLFVAFFFYWFLVLSKAL